MWRNRLKKFAAIDRINAAWRARQLERFAARGLADYRRAATSKGITPLAPDALRDALAKRFAATGRHIRPKPKGDLHIFVPFGLQNWEHVLPRSLEPFGTVTPFEWRSLDFDDTRAPADWLSHRDRMNCRLLDDFSLAHARRPIDVVCAYVSGYTVSPQTVEAMTRAGAVVLNFCYDDKVSFPGRVVGDRYTSPAALAHAVDLNLTSAPDSVIKYQVHGGLAMFWPEAAHPQVHHPHDTPFEFDVTFAGRRFGWRPAFVRELARHGVHVECFGNGWPNGPLSDEELVRLYSRSRINLGSGGIGHSIRLQCLKGRDFEVPMSGGLYLTSHNPELSLCYDLGNEILTYQDPSDCAQTIRRLLDRPDEAARIRAAGRRRALADHTYEARWGEALRICNLLR